MLRKELIGKGEVTEGSAGVRFRDQISCFSCLSAGAAAFEYGNSGRSHALPELMSLAGLSSSAFPPSTPFFVSKTILE